LVASPLNTDSAKFSLRRTTSRTLTTHGSSETLKLSTRCARGWDRNGGREIELIYSLCLPYSTLRDEEQREAIIEALDGIPIQSLWLRVDGCGADSTPTAVRNYASACWDFGHVGVPIVADQIGGLPGLSLLALSGVGGLASGLAVGERFHAAHWHRAQAGNAFMAHSRVYLPALDLSLDSDDAKSLFSANVRLKGLFGCKDPDCCARGVIDMLERPARHFAIQRMKQIAEISHHPQTLRPSLFLERSVRPTTDYALQLSKAVGIGEQLQKRMAKHRHRLDGMRLMLAKLIDSNQVPTQVRTPKTRVMREGAAPASR
jgi:hypothetical protein